MPITELNHYLLVAKDLERTKSFYQNVLGLDLAERPDFGFPGYWLKTGDHICVHLASQEPNKTRDLGIAKLLLQTEDVPVDRLFPEALARTEVTAY